MDILMMWIILNHEHGICFLISSFISLLTHSLFNGILFSFYMFEWFWVFSLGLVSSFKNLWSEKMLDMISIFLNLLSLVLCPIMWSIFENVLCAFEKNVYFASLGWKFLYLSVKSFWCMAGVSNLFVLGATTACCCLQRAECNFRTA